MQKHPFLEPINYIRPFLETPVFRLFKHLYNVSPLSLALSFYCSRFQPYSLLSDIARLCWFLSVNGFAQIIKGQLLHPFSFPIPFPSFMFTFQLINKE